MAKKASKKKNLGKRLNFSKPSKRTTLLSTAIILAVGLFGASGYLWWTRSFTDADRVFADMLSNNLSSSSVARRVQEKNQSSSVDQSVYVSFASPEVISQTRTVLGEKGQNRKTTTVTTETIGTKDADFVRYVSAEGAEDLSVAGNLDSILGVWGKRTPNTEIGEQANFLNEAVFSLVPYGNLPLEERKELLAFIKDKKAYELKDSIKNFDNGRYIYNYNVVLQPKAFVEVLAKYVELTGIGDTSQLDPAAYENAPAIVVQMKVDIFSRQLLSIEYISTGRIETIESRGLRREITLPEQSIPFNELQQRLLRGSANS